MDIYQTEEQQVEAIKKFWQNNKKTIFLVAILFTAGYFGMKYYNHHKQIVLTDASNEFVKLLNATQAKDDAAIKNYGDTLQTKFKNTAYAELTALELAKVAVINKDFKAAEDQLLWMINKNKKGPLYHIAVIRLSRLYRNNGEYEKALQLLNNNPNGFSALYDEVKGDIYMDKNDLNAAKKLYSEALNAAPKSGATPWLQLKLEDLSNIDTNTES